MLAGAKLLVPWYDLIPRKISHSPETKKNGMPKPTKGCSAREEEEEEEKNYTNILDCREKFQISLEISWKFLSSFWQRWSNLRALPTALCCLAFI
jgi:hypothetical protein